MSDEIQKPMTEIIDELYDEFLNDCKINDMRLQEELVRIPTIRSKWVTMRARYFHSFKEAKKKKEYCETITVSKVFDQKKKRGDDVKHKIQVEREVKSSKHYKDIIQTISDIEVILGQIEGYIESFNSLSWALKTKVDLMKIEEI